MSISYSLDDDDDFSVVSKAETSAAPGRLYADFCRVGEAFQVYIARAALKRALRHTESGYAETGGEVAGALIGSLQYDAAAGVTFVEINETVPVQSFSANFDVAIDPTEWSKAENVTQEPQFRGRCVVVGWYHSHPNIGIFLSAVDLNTQSTHFGVDWQVAIVVDPVRMEIGAFNGSLGAPCPLYVIPSTGDVALTPAAAALAHLDDPPAVIRSAAWRSPFVLGAAGVLLLALLGLSALFFSTSSQVSAGQAQLTAAAATNTFVAYNTRISGEAAATVNAAYADIDQRGFATLTAVAESERATAVAGQRAAVADLTSQAGAYFAQATAQANAVQTALAGALNGQTATAIVIGAAATAGAAQATQAARPLQVTLTAVAGRVGPPNGAQQTAVAGVTATRAAAEISIGRTATAAAAALLTAQAFVPPTDVKQVAAAPFTVTPRPRAPTQAPVVATRPPTRPPTRAATAPPTAAAGGAPPAPAPPTAIPPTAPPPPTTAPGFPTNTARPVPPTQAPATAGPNAPTKVPAPPTAPPAPTAGPPPTPVPPTQPPAPATQAPPTQPPPPRPTAIPRPTQPPPTAVPPTAPPPPTEPPPPPPPTEPPPSATPKPPPPTLTPEPPPTFTPKPPPPTFTPAIDVTKTPVPRPTTGLGSTPTPGGTT
jgi:proteasome lid subunit RPN8/RPN11